MSLGTVVRRSGGGYAGVPFDPTQLTGLVAWFDADNLGLADGTAVSSWTDRSGNARHAVQATGTKQPLQKTAILNGKRIVRFDGVDDFLASTYGLALTQPTTIFLVGKMLVAGAYYCDGITTGARHAIGDGISGAGQHSLYAGGTAIGAAQAVPTVFNYWTGVVNGASSVLYKNGVSFATGSPGGHQSTGITLGNRYIANAGSTLSGDIAEVCVYNGAQSTADRQRVEAYLAAKWGL